MTAEKALAGCLCVFRYEEVGGSTGLGMGHDQPVPGFGLYQDKDLWSWYCRPAGRSTRPLPRIRSTSTLEQLDAKKWKKKAGRF